MPGIGTIESDGHNEKGIICESTDEWCNMKAESCPYYCDKCKTCACMHVAGEEDYPEVSHE